MGMHLLRPIADMIQLLTFEPIQCGLFFFFKYTLHTLHPSLCIYLVWISLCMCELVHGSMCLIMSTYVQTWIHVIKHPLKPLSLGARCCREYIFDKRQCEAQQTFEEVCCKYLWTTIILRSFLFDWKFRKPYVWDCSLNSLCCSDL